LNAEVSFSGLELQTPEIVLQFVVWRTFCYYLDLTSSINLVWRFSWAGLGSVHSRKDAPIVSLQSEKMHNRSKKIFDKKGVCASFALSNTNFHP
jgi:hypothetical protein